MKRIKVPVREYDGFSLNDLLSVTSGQQTIFFSSFSAQDGTDRSSAVCAKRFPGVPKELMWQWEFENFPWLNKAPLFASQITAPVVRV